MAAITFEERVDQGVKIYKALLTQVGTNAPTAVVQKNTLGGTLVWTRQSTGVYRGTLIGAFPDLNKVNLLIGPMNDFNFFGDYFRVCQSTGVGSTDYIEIVTESGVAPSTSNSDDILGQTTIMIEVYP